MYIHIPRIAVGWRGHSGIQGGTAGVGDAGPPGTAIQARGHPTQPPAQGVVQPSPAASHATFHVPWLDGTGGWRLEAGG